MTLVASVGLGLCFVIVIYTTCMCYKYTCSAGTNVRTYIHCFRHVFAGVCTVYSTPYTSHNVMDFKMCIWLVCMPTNDCASNAQDMQIS